MSDRPFDDGLASFKREPISISILNTITDSILRGRLKPGDKLPTELELARKMRVSRNSVREALKMLSSLGVIEVRRGSGTFISTAVSSSVLDQLLLSLAFQQGTSRELVEVRKLIEIGAAELAIDHASDAQIGLLEQANERLRAAARQHVRNAHVLRDLDLQVHYTLLEISNNAFVAEIGKTIDRLFFTSIEATVRVSSMEAYGNHRMYIEAIRKRDKDLARTRVHQAMSVWMEYVNRTSGR